MKIILQHQGVMDKDVAANIADLEAKDKAGTITEADDLHQPEFALDDTAFDVPGWISVEVGGVSVAEIHINDLYPAALAYKERYERAME